MARTLRYDYDYSSWWNNQLCNHDDSLTSPYRITPKAKEEPKLSPEEEQLARSFIEQRNAVYKSKEEALADPNPKENRYFPTKGGWGVIQRRVIDSNEMTFITKANECPLFDDVAATVEVKIVNKIPKELLHEVVSTFNRIVKQSGDEAAAQIYREKGGERNYIIYYPVQEISKARVVYKNDPVPVQMRATHDLIMELHSHNTMSAFWSGEDNSNEQDCGFYMVIGTFGSTKATYRCRAKYGNTYIEFPAHKIFNMSEEEEDWIFTVGNCTEGNPDIDTKVKKTSYSYGSYGTYGSTCGYVYGDYDWHGRPAATDYRISRELWKRDVRYDNAFKGYTTSDKKWVYNEGTWVSTADFKTRPTLADVGITDVGITDPAEQEPVSSPQQKATEKETEAAGAGNEPGIPGGSAPTQEKEPSTAPKETIPEVTVSVSKDKAQANTELALQMTPNISDSSKKLVNSYIDKWKRYIVAILNGKKDLYGMFLVGDIPMEYESSINYLKMHTSVLTRTTTSESSILNSEKPYLLINAYATAKSLEMCVKTIKLYGNIYGGTALDEYMSSNCDEFLELETVDDVDRLFWKYLFDDSADLPGVDAVYLWSSLTPKEQYKLAYYIGSTVYELSKEFMSMTGELPYILVKLIYVILCIPDVKKAGHNDTTVDCRSKTLKDSITSYVYELQDLLADADTGSINSLYDSISAYPDSLGYFLKYEGYPVKEDTLENIGNFDILDNLMVLDDGHENKGKYGEYYGDDYITDAMYLPDEIELDLR